VGQEDLKDFPALRQALLHVGGVAGGTCFMDELVGQWREGLSDELSPVNRVLADLLESFEPHEFDEPIRALFEEDKRWRAADTELRGLWHVHRHGALSSIGWAGGAGGSAPFDGVFRLPGERLPIPFDIKDAQGARRCAAASPTLRGRTALGSDPARDRRGEIAGDVDPA